MAMLHSLSAPPPQAQQRSSTAGATCPGALLSAERNSKRGGLQDVICNFPFSMETVLEY